jgi:hypothetical protein
MNWAVSLFVIFAATCIGMTGYGLVRRGAAYSYPFLAAAICLTFVLPQIPGLLNDRAVPESALAATLLMALLCLLMCHVGWHVGLQGSPSNEHSYSEQRLLHVAVILSAVGSYSFYKFGQLPDEERLRGLLSGTSVAILFFARLLTYGFAIAVTCLVNRRSFLAWAIVCVDTGFYLQRIFIAGRRGETAEFCLIIALAFWFRHKWAIPRTLVLAGLLMSLVGLLGAREYRAASWYGETKAATIADIDLYKNWKELQDEGGPEMRNAVYAIKEKSETGDFEYSFGTWNNLIFSYVPAQLVGESFKSGLMLTLNPTFERGREPPVGSTYTGFYDAFGSFWYLGCFKFFVIAALMGSIYVRALRGDEAMQILYALSVVPSMLVITHFTDEIIVSWVHIGVFLLPAFWYVKGLRRPTFRVIPSAHTVA